jgi:hypothetical protein
LLTEKVFDWNPSKFILAELMKKLTHSQVSCLSAALLVSAISAHAAGVSFVGVDLNVDLPAPADGTVNQPGGWRTATDTKAFDIDGDNVYGTDGYFLRGGTDTSASFLDAGSAFELVGGGNPFGAMDNPANPTGLDDFAAGFWGSRATGSLDLFSFTVAGTDLDGKTLRVGVHTDVFQNGDNTVTYTWTQTAGTGGGTATSSEVTTGVNDGYDFVFFDIDGAVAGDQFTLSMIDATPASGDNWNQYNGVVFDVVPEPSSFGLLAGMFGLTWVMLRRR